MALFLNKFRKKYIWKRLFYERLTEPLHLNLLAVMVGLFGGLRTKIDFDLLVRQFNAYSILNCADQARRLGLKEVTIVEFGVAAGTGLVNMHAIAQRVTRETGIRFRIAGFDTGTGMPAPESYRDHPELYQQGDFPMDQAALRKRLPADVELVIGNVAETLPAFLSRLTPEAPLGYMSLDLDYYSSSKLALRVLTGLPQLYLPRTLIYLDDLEDESHNSYCGELLAVNEFNAENQLRKIERHFFLRDYRIFRNARWIDHMFTMHVLDHPTRTVLEQPRAAAVLENPYL